MRAIQPNNDFTNPEAYRNLSRNNNHSGRLVEVYGCGESHTRYEWFVIGRASDGAIYLWDGVDFYSTVNPDAKTYFKATSAPLVGKRAIWDEVRDRINPLHPAA